MTATNDFNSEISNSSLDSLQYYVDTDGSLNFVSPYISSANFDGTIPVVEQNITASSLAPGMLLEVNPSQFFPVISLQYDDPDLEVSPSSNITVSYLDSTNSLNSVVYNFLDTVLVRYEDWDQKVLGTQGWSITSGGNAIFANVGVRGDLEATTLDVGGDLGITYDGTTVTLGASVVINAPVTFNGSGSFVTLDYLSSSYALQTFVNTLNTRLSSSISTLSINASTLSASMDFLYNAGFVTDTDLVTNGATVINGNNITTGTISANRLDISSGLTGNRGVRINSLGLKAFNANEVETFSINSGTGDVTINGGTLTITSGSNIDGYATDGELSSGLSGKVDDGQAAADIITYNTTITGGNIATGRIKSGGYRGPGTGSAFSITGMLINLDDGGVASKRFRIDPDGNAVFSGSVIAGVFKSNNSITPTSGNGVYLDNEGKVRFASSTNSLTFDGTNVVVQGQIKGTSGFFGTENNNWSFGVEPIAGYDTAYIRSGTLKLYTALSGTPPTLHGSIIITASNNATVGRFSNPVSSNDKSIYALGNGIHLGTENDYLFIPGPNNTRSPIIRSNGFEFRAADTSDTLAFKVGNNEISLPAGSTINFWNDSQSPAAYLDYGPTNNQLVIGVGAGPGGSTFNGIVNFRASDVRLNGTSIVGGGGGGGGVTSFKFGDNGPTETGAVAITGAEIITAINNNSIENAKLTNKGITIGEVNPVSVNLGGSLGSGTIHADVLSAGSLNPNRIDNTLTLVNIGGTAIRRQVAVSTITGPLTIGTLTSNGLTVSNIPAGTSTTQDLNYSWYLGTTAINLNRSSGALGATLGGVNISGSAAQLNNTTSLIGTTWGGQGGIIYNNNGVLAGTAAGTTGQFLRSNGAAAPTWQTVNILTNPMTAAGDLIYGGASGTPTRLAAGGTGAILRVSGGIPSWIGLPTTGAAGRVLTINSLGTDIEWASPPSGTLPSQTGNTGRYLRTDGTNTSWQYPVTSISVPTGFTSTFNSTTGTNTIGYTTTDGGDRNVLRSIATGAVGFGKINAGHINITADNQATRFFVRLNATDLSTLYYSTSNTYTSSKRFKKITSNSIIEDSSWIDEINLVKFKYNADISNFGEDSARESIGLIAEDAAINPVLNQIVTYDETGPEGIEYDKLSVLLIPIIKELRDKVADLEARLDAAGL